MPKSPSIIPFRVLSSHFSYPTLIPPSKIYTLTYKNIAHPVTRAKDRVLCSYIGLRNSFDYFSFS